jgi:hypothetical protein
MACQLYGQFCWGCHSVTFLGLFWGFFINELIFFRYVIPALLVYKARRKVGLVQNPYSWFKGDFWVGFVLIWFILSVFLVFWHMVF